MNWVDFVVRGTILLTAAFVAAYASRQRSAAVRHFVWTLAFVAALLLPVAMRVGPQFAVGVLPASAGPGRVAVAPAGMAAVQTPQARGSILARQAVRQGRSPALNYASSLAEFSRTGSYLAGFYLVGLLLAMGRFLSGAGQRRQMSLHAKPASYAREEAAKVRAELAIRREVRVLESTSAAVPMTWGVIGPVVLLPPAARQWPEGRMHAVLLHEMVHVARYDLLAQMAAQAACCLYWFHPLVWIAARHLRKERERACDDAVLGRGVAAPDYAGHLMELARVLVERQASLADAPAMAETGDLEDRVRALLDRGRNRAPLTVVWRPP